jgi:biopolymer transport protein ExbD
MTPYRIRRHGKRHSGASHFALIPFIDMMTILVVFLLAHTAEVDILPNSKSISIPQSLSERKPQPTVVVMITKDSLYVDGRLLGTVAALASGVDPIILPLKDALMAQNDTILRATQGADTSKREVTIMGDKTTPYSVLKKIMMTCTAADYGKVSFAVVERERAAG